MKRRDFCHSAGWVAGGVLILPHAVRTVLANPLATGQEIGYRLQVSTTNKFAFADLVYDIKGYADGDLRPGDLESSKTYFWRVADHDGAAVDLLLVRDYGYFFEREMLTHLVEMYNGLTLPWIISRDTTSPVDTESEEEIPQKFALDQNYPNPFNPVTTIPFALPERAFVRITVYNLLGQEVATIAEQDFPAGEHSISWNVADLASGTYIYALQADDFTSSKQMVLLK